MGLGQFRRALPHFLFQPVLMPDQALVALLDFAQHVIERHDQFADLVVRVLWYAQLIGLFVGDGASRIGNVPYGL